jgi:hypothetical protein
MGTYFTALMNHNLDEKNIHALPDLLNSSWRTIEPLMPIIEGYPVPGCSPDQWQWGTNDGGFSFKRLHNHEAIFVEGHEFHGGVSERIFMLSHGVRWWSFLTEQAVRDKLRRVCRHTASVLGSNQVIYLPSGFLKPEGAIGLMHEGGAAEEMIDWLIENCGPPLQDIKSIYRGELGSWNENGYYIERL